MLSRSTVVALLTPVVVLLAVPAVAQEVSIPHRYAPLVWLHPDERYLPMSADTFIRNSSLNWNRDQGCRDHSLAVVGQVFARRLGSGAYRHRWSRSLPLCTEYGRHFRSDEYTRPGSGVSGGEGFLLDLRNERRGGEGASAPAYYEYVPGRYITYWFLYGFSLPPGPPDIMPMFAHEGDWEGISIELNAASQPTRAAFFAHGLAPVAVPWNQVSKEMGGHPIVYSAKGSHASYHQCVPLSTSIPGPVTKAAASGSTCQSRPIDAKVHLPLISDAFGNVDLGTVYDHIGRGRPWRTWNNLRDVRAEPWYRFGGAWGEIAFETGPAAPPYKPQSPFVNHATTPIGNVCREPSRPYCCGTVTEGRCDDRCVRRRTECDR